MINNKTKHLQIIDESFMNNFILSLLIIEKT